MKETNSINATSYGVKAADEMISGATDIVTPRPKLPVVSQTEEVKEDPKPQQQHHSFILGRTRICDSAGYRGTVMYVGPVASIIIVVIIIVEEFNFENIRRDCVG